MIDVPHKIFVPQRPYHLITRQQPLTYFCKLVQQRQIIAVTAPTGYGKTSLLIDFAQVSPFPLCWYMLDSYDADPWVFIEYLAAAIRRTFPASLPQTWTMLGSNGHPVWRSVVASLMREISMLGQDAILVLDDWHLVSTSAEIAHLIADLAAHCPNLHIILTSRERTVLPNEMLLTARRQFVCLDEGLLCFTPDEVMAVVAADETLAIPPEQVRGLAAEYDGWIAGILLAVESAQRTPDGVAPSSHQRTQRLLSEQILNHLPPHIQTFLHETSLLDEVTAPQCDALLGRCDSAELLDYVLAKRLFVRELLPGVVRYHPIFRDLLIARFRRLEPARYRTIMDRLTRSYVDQRHWSRAFDLHKQAGDLESARQILEAGGHDLHSQGRLETLEHLFAAIPQHLLDAPLLCLKARVELDRGNPQRAAALIERAAQAAPIAPDVLLAQALLARVSGRYQDAIAFASQVLASAPSAADRGAAMRTIAIAQHRLGDRRAAIDTLQTALDAEEHTGSSFTYAQTLYDLAICYSGCGELRAAEAAFIQVEQRWAELGNQGLHALCANSLALTQHLLGKTKQAWASTQQALGHARAAAIPQYLAAVLSTVGDIAADLGQWQEAASAYESARRAGGSAYIAAHVAISQALLLAHQQRYTEAARTLDTLEEAAQRQEPALALIVRATLAAGVGDLAAALGHAREAVAQARMASARPTHVRALALQAAICSARNPADSAEPVALLREAMAVAESIGHEAILIIATMPHQAMLRRCIEALPQARRWLATQRQMRAQAAALVQPVPLPTLELHTLGAAAALLDGHDLELGGRKEHHVLAYLAAHPRGATSEELIEAIWVEDSPKDTARALYNVIYRLRTLLPDQAITKSGQQRYAINPQAVRLVWDAALFRERLRAASAASAHERLDYLWDAVEYYHGSYLAYIDAPWCAATRAELEEQYRSALHQAAELASQHRLWLDAYHAYQQVLRLDPCDEQAHSGVMRYYLAIGNRAAAIAHYHRCRAIFQQELHIALDPASEPAQIFRTLQ